MVVWLTENSTSVEDYSGDQEDAEAEASPDVTLWLQAFCRKNYRRKCTGLNDSASRI